MRRSQLHPVFMNTGTNGTSTARKYKHISEVEDAAIFAVVGWFRFGEKFGYLFMVLCFFEAL